MLNKRKTAFLCACCLLACTMTSTTIHADEVFVMTKDSTGNMILTTEEDINSLQTLNTGDRKEIYTKGEHGEAYGYITERDGGYVVTTAEGLPEDCLYQIYGVTMQDSNIPDSYTVTEVDPDSLNWAKGYEDWFQQYPQGAKLYYVGKSYITEMKKLFQKFDSVLDVVYLWNEYQSECAWDGTVSLSVRDKHVSVAGYITLRDNALVYLDKGGNSLPFPDRITDEEKAILKERLLVWIQSNPDAKFTDYEYDEELQKAVDSIDENIVAVGTDWKKRYDEWYNSIEEETRKAMTPAELEASRIAAGVESSYDMIQKAYQLCEEHMQTYSDTIYSVFPNIDKKYRAGFKQENIEITDDGQIIYHTPKRPQTLWETFGDTDNDHTITAGDATNLLKYCAGISSGAIYQNPADKENKLEIYDMNADGNIDASDAYTLLQYVSESGSGKVHSMPDFFKKQNITETN